MEDHPQIHYLCASGEVKKRAEAHRRAFTKLRKALFDVVHSLGATRCRIQDSMLLLQGITFEGEPPTGWTKKDKGGCSRPKPTKANAEILKHFTPSGGYCIETHPDLLDFEKWLGCPMSYEYTQAPTSKGWSTIGRMFADGVLYWYSATGPILAILPDIAAARIYAEEHRQVVVGNVLDWKPPKGLKRILPEEWKLMQAKHKLKAVA